MVGHALTLHYDVVHEAVSSCCFGSLASFVLLPFCPLLVNPSAIVLLLPKNASLDGILVGFDLAGTVHGVNEVLLGNLAQHRRVVVRVKALVEHLA